MTKNWITYFEQKLIPLNPTDIEYSNNDSYSSRTYYFNDSYLIIELLDSTTIKKVQLGTIKKRKFSNYKILFDKSITDYIKVKQTLFEIDENENYVLTFDEFHLKILNEFLDNLFSKGWTEKTISYKGKEYLIKVFFNQSSYRIELKSDAEQDIPMIGDFLDRKINVLWKNLGINSINLKTEILQIKPLY